MGAAASCNTARAIPYTIDGEMLSLPPQATHIHQPCWPAEVTFHWLGTQKRETVDPNHRERYTMVRGDDGECWVEPG
jgi:hypothetical protein